MWALFHSNWKNTEMNIGSFTKSAHSCPLPVIIWTYSYIKKIPKQNFYNVFFTKCIIFSLIHAVFLSIVSINNHGSVANCWKLCYLGMLWQICKMTHICLFFWIYSLDNLFKPKGRLISGKEMQLRSRRLVQHKSKHIACSLSVYSDMRKVFAPSWFPLFFA